MTVSSSKSGIHATDAIAQGAHLLTFGWQVIVFEVLQPNGVLAIPHSHAATKVIHCADNSPTATLGSQIWVSLAMIWQAQTPLNLSRRLLG
ncbi:MAG: hypothetical protein KME55_39025 [Nostoc indistinguendum CM1-VF10]|nr:hypothetical protein [Nostoc indistinguendum CM1-VF10]